MLLFFFLLLLLFFFLPSFLLPSLKILVVISFVLFPLFCRRLYLCTVGVFVVAFVDVDNDVCDDGDDDVAADVCGVQKGGPKGTAIPLLCYRHVVMHYCSGICTSVWGWR